MRLSTLILTLIFLSGCVGNTMNAAEIAACVNATQTQLVDIPNCNTNETCVAEWQKIISVPTFTHLPVNENAQKIQHYVIQSWIAMRHAQETLTKAQLACEKGDLIGLIQNGSPAAGSIQVALKATEEGQWEWTRLLTATAERASKEEWTRIKDTQGYEDYAKIIEILHDLSTDSQTTTLGKKWGDSQHYYNDIANQLTQNPLPSKPFEWGDIFSWYDTGIKIAFPEKKQNLIWFSTIWKSALQSLTKSKSQNTALTLLKSIQGEEMMQHLELFHSPKNGILIEGLKLVTDLETQWQKEEKLEKEKIIELKKRADEQEKQWNKINDEWTENKTSTENLTMYFETYEITSTFIQPKDATQWNNLNYILLKAEQQSIDKTEPLGRRIETIRKIEKQLNDWSEKISEFETDIETMNTSCQKLSDKLELDSLSCADLEKQTNMQSSIEENPLSLLTCVEQINQILEATSGEVYTSEMFTLEFGDAAQSACVNTLKELENQYWNSPSNQEWTELSQKVKEKWNALKTAQLFYPEQFPTDKKLNEQVEKILNSENEWLTLEETAKEITQLQNMIMTLNQRILDGMQLTINDERWTITNPLPLESGEQHADVSFDIINPFGQTLMIEGKLALPQPINALSIENEVNEEGTMILSNLELPITGKTIIGKGEGNWLSDYAQTKMSHLWGNIAEQETTITLTSQAHIPEAYWEMKLPIGIIQETIVSTHDGKSTPFVMDASLHGITPLFVSEEKIVLSYQQKGVIQSTLNLISQEETEAVTTTTYSLVVTSILEEETTPTVSTGLIPSPVETHTILVFAEDGKKAPFSTGPAGEIILDSVNIPPKGTRTLSILVSENKPEGKPFVQDTLEDELDDLTQNDDLSIAAAAEKLWNKVKNNTNPNAWPELVNEWLALQALAENKPLIENPDAETQIILPEMEKYTQEIEETTNLLQEIKTEIEKYETATNITCTKLQEVSYFCPIEETSIRTWKKERDTAEKEILLQKKRIANEKTTIEQLVNDQEKRKNDSQQWNVRKENLENALSQMKETATQLLNEVKKIGSEDTRESVQNALQKGKESFEKNEFGKTIFITKNLRSFFQSENKISGLVSIPWQGWPLLGIILIAGGIFTKREWEKKKKVPVPLKPLPMHASKTNPPRAPRGSVGLKLPHTREEDQ